MERTGAIDAATFALMSADALSGSLNLRRTVARVVELAMNRFGAWAAVSYVDGTQLRRFDSAGADDFSEHARPRTVRELDAAAADALYGATARAGFHPVPVPVEVLAAVGVPAGSAERLAQPGAVLVTFPLASTMTGRAVLAVVADRPPAMDELSQFARRAARAIAAAAVYEEQATLARTLRDALVPAALPSIPSVQLGASYRPAQEASQIGGDFYDIAARPDGSWAVSIGDVCGKGVDAAVLTGQVRQSLRTAALVTDDPVHTLSILNQTLLRSHGNTFVTALFGAMHVEQAQVRLKVASGGHPPPFVLRGAAVEVLPTRGTIIGMLPAAHFEATELTLARGELVLLYTDGLPEARGAAGLLGSEPVMRVLADSVGLSAQAVTERIMQLVLEHLGGWPHDDIAVLAIRALDEAGT